MLASPLRAARFRRCFFFGVGALGLVRLAAAQSLSRALEQATQLDYQGSCVTRAALVRQLERWVKRSGSFSPDLKVRVLGQDLPEFRASFEISRGEELVARREFSGADIQCQQRVAVLSSALGLALENYLEAEQAGKLTVTQPPPPPRQPPSLPPSAPWRLHSYAGGWLGAGLMPEPSWSAAIGIGLSKGGWGGRTGAFLTPVQSLALGEGEVRVQLLGGDLGACRFARVVTLPVGVCLGGRVGMARVSGAGYEVSFDQREPFLDAVLTLTLEPPLAGMVALYLGGELGMTLAAPSLVVRDQQTGSLLASRAWPSLSGGLVAGLRFDLSRSPPKKMDGAGH